MRDAGMRLVKARQVGWPRRGVRRGCATVAGSPLPRLLSSQPVAALGGLLALKRWLATGYLWIDDDALRFEREQTERPWELDPHPPLGLIVPAPTQHESLKQQRLKSKASTPCVCHRRQYAYHLHLLLLLLLPLLLLLLHQLPMLLMLLY